MDPNPSTLIVIAIAAVGAIAWLAGLSVMARATRDRRARAEEAAERFEIAEPAAAGTIVGEVEVEGRPEELSEKLARLLARDGMGPLGPVKIVACDRSELIFESAGPVPGSAASGSVSRPVPILREGLADPRRVRHRGALRARPARLRLALRRARPRGADRRLLAHVRLRPAEPQSRACAARRSRWCRSSTSSGRRSSSPRCSRQPARMIQARVSAMVHNLPYS